MISIVIIVKNDKRIFTLLEKLEKISTKQKFETIVIDASDILLLNKYKLFKKVRLYKYPPKRKKTYAEQRNEGIRKAKGDIVVFIDADCLPSNSWLDELIDPILNEKESIVSGAVRPLHNNFIHIEVILFYIL